MLNLNYSSKFKKDYKRCQKQGRDMQLLQNVISILSIPALLPPQNKDHTLSGNYAGNRECHILPDWLLIYQIVGSELYLVRTGTHAELFGI